MNFVKGLWKHVIIIIIGIILAFFARWIEYDSQDLSASVLSLTEQEFFESTKWDAWYKKRESDFWSFFSRTS